MLCNLFVAHCSTSSSVRLHKNVVIGWPSKLPLPVTQAAAKILAGIHFACNSRGASALQHVKECVVTCFFINIRLYYTLRTFSKINYVI